jgi:sugar phosphate isomerase/epimerase
MTRGIFAKTFSGTDPHTVLQKAKLAGYHAVQYNMACSGLPSLPETIPLKAALQVADAAKAHGLSVSAVSCTFNMIHPDKVVRDSGLRQLETVAAACQGIGTRLVTLCTGTRDPDDQWRFHFDNASPEAWRDLIRTMQAAVTIADRWNIDLGIEPEPANVVNSAIMARQLIDDMQSQRLRIVIDPANLTEHAASDDHNDIVTKAVDLLADRIAMAHAKDRDSKGRVVAAGKGVMDFRHLAVALQSVGFSGPVITHGLAESEAAETAQYLGRTMGI